VTAPNQAAAPVAAACDHHGGPPLWRVLWFDQAGTHDREAGGASYAEAAFTVAVTLDPATSPVLIDVIRLR
jgi:hypothetical protein